MKKRKFLIPSFVAAGLIPIAKEPAQGATLIPQPDPNKSAPLYKLFKLDHRYMLAGHSSHSSHASHSSHSSHYSSSGGGGGYSGGIGSSGGETTAPATNPTYTAPDYSNPPVFTPPAEQPLSVLPGNSDKFKKIVMQVELALTAFGYITGPIDGVLDPTSRAALMRMQFDYNLKVTGTITPEVLDAFKIVAQ